MITQQIRPESSLYSAGSSQDELLNSIITLYLPAGRIQLDVCYNKGGFYKSGRVKSPEIKNDLNIFSPDISNFDVRSIPFSAETFESIIFDPPFLVGSAENHMIKRYGGFRTMREMWDFQRESIREISRVLKKGGVLITKIQDFTHGRQKYFPSYYQIGVCQECRLYLVDSFILVNRNRFRAKDVKSSAAVSAHCYFNVFRKQTRQQRIRRY